MPDSSLHILKWLLLSFLIKFSNILKFKSLPNLWNLRFRANFTLFFSQIHIPQCFLMSTSGAVVVGKKKKSPMNLETEELALSPGSATYQLYRQVIMLPWAYFLDCKIVIILAGTYLTRLNKWDDPKLPTLKFSDYVLNKCLSPYPVIIHCPYF